MTATARSSRSPSFVQVDPSMVVESPFALIGTPAQMVEDLLRRRERWGFSYVIVGADDVEPFAPVVAELAGIDARSRSRTVEAVRPSGCTCRSSAACHTFDAWHGLGLVRRP